MSYARDPYKTNQRVLSDVGTKVRGRFKEESARAARREGRRYAREAVGFEIDEFDDVPEPRSGKVDISNARYV